MAVLLALASALAYGLSDFVGGLASRRASAWAVAVVVQATATVGGILIALGGGGSPSAVDLAWGVLGGVGSGAGVGFLFRGLASGRMSVVAPLSAVGAALMPVAAGLVSGERPSLLAGVAIAAAFPGIWLVASGEDRPVPAEDDATDATDLTDGPDLSTSSSGVLDGVLAGLGFGVMFTALGQVGDDAGLWPTAVVQGVSTLSAAGLAAALGAAWWPDRAAWRAAPAGLLSAVAIVAFQLATRDGLLAVSSVLASLYPAATILLAVAVLRERVRRSQAAGLVLCGVTVSLVALG